MFYPGLYSAHLCYRTIQRFTPGFAIHQAMMQLEQYHQQKTVGIIIAMQYYMRVALYYRYCVVCSITAETGIPSQRI